MASQEYRDNLKASLVSAERAKARAESDLKFASTPARKAAAQRTIANANTTITSLKGGIATNEEDLSNASQTASPTAPTQAPQGGPMSLGGVGSGTYWDAVNKTWVVTDAPPSAPATNVNQRLTTQQAASLTGNTETGTNPAIKKLTETQSVSPDATNTMKAYLSANKESLNASAGAETVDYGNIAAGNNNGEYTGVRGIDQSTINYSNEGRNTPGPAGPAGAGAPGDDGSTAANTSTILNAFDKQPFFPQPNVLDQYASYTYNLGWYLLTPESYAAGQLTHTPVIKDYNLLMQSGGAPPNVGGAMAERANLSEEAYWDDGNGEAPASVVDTPSAAGRNPFFTNDYYIDNLTLKSSVTGKGTLLAHNVTNLEFTVTEPNSITLIDNLWKAVKNQYNNSNIPYSTAFYALVIRFYGYDDQGKLVQTANNGVIVQKVIPFKIADIGFKVANKLVEYEIKGTAIPNQIGFGANLGVVKERIQVSGATVKDLLTNGVVLAEVSPDDGRKPVIGKPTVYGPRNDNINPIINTDSNTVGDGSLDVSHTLVAP